MESASCPPSLVAVCLLWIWRFHLIGRVKVIFWLLFIRNKIVLVLLATKIHPSGYVSPYNISIYPFTEHSTILNFFKDKPAKKPLDFS